jgi:TonB family protein
MEGYVIIEALIGTDGTVKSATVLNKAPLFEKDALEAVKKWKYTPTTLSGVPVEIIMNITVQFRLK